MTSLLARLGHLSFDTRRAAQTFLSNAGKRKRGSQWVCAECRARRTGMGRVQQQQRRGYSDDGIRLGGEGYLFPPQENEVDSRERRAERSGWGLRRDGADGTGEQVQPRSVKMATRGKSVEEQREDLWEQFEAFDEAEDAQQKGASARLGTATEDEYEADVVRDQSLLKLDYKAELSPALLRAETDLVMRCLFAANQANDVEFIRAIPATTFSEIIRLAEPRRFISKLGSAHVELSAVMVNRMKIAPMRQIAYEYTSVIRQMLGIRKSAGIKLTLGDYTILLRSARDLGNARMGQLLWRHMLDEGYKPNTQCYNYMMSTIVWNGSHLAGSRHKVRIVPFNMLGRRKQTSTRFHNYRVGPAGVRETALSIFNEMLVHGAYADYESFRILMTASAREGDLQTVKSILMKVWNIDVDGIMAGKPESSMLPKQRPDYSPLRPTTDILFTLAHVFGINNDIPTALRVVDFVARHYSLELDAKTWSQLFEWTFVLARDRLNAARRLGTDAGVLPRESLLNLWDTMTLPPYNFKPTMGMYNHLIKHLSRNNWVADMAQKMNEARKPYNKHRQRARRAYRALRDATESSRSGDQFHRPNTRLEMLRNTYEQADLLRQRDLFWLKRWVRLFLGAHNNYFKNDHRMDSTVRRLPRLLWDWRLEAPSEVRYETQTGMVKIQFRTEEELLDNAKYRHARQSEVQRMTDTAAKLVGQTWVRGGEAQKMRRLQEHEMQGQLGAKYFSSKMESNR